MKKVQRMYDRQINKVSNRIHQGSRGTGQSPRSMPQYVTSSFRYESAQKNNLRSSQFSNRSSTNGSPKSVLSGIALELKK